MALHTIMWELQVQHSELHLNNRQHHGGLGLYSIYFQSLGCDPPRYNEWVAKGTAI